MVELRLAKMKMLHELIDFLHGDKPYEVRNYIMSEIAKTTDNNKGRFWEQVLYKAMKNHTLLLEGNAVGRDFSDNTDAKFATFYKKNKGLGDYQASIGNIRTKIGPLRVCLCVPGQTYHKVYFLFIPYESYQYYTYGSDSIKFGLSPSGKPTGKMAQYLCSFEEVTKPYICLTNNTNSSIL